VEVYSDHVLRGCKHCRHSISIWLPPIRKSVLYLDQFFFSGAFRGGDARFVSAAVRIRDLAAKQLLTVPFSSIHEDETHQWERREELYEFIKATSRGHEFEPAYDVEREQILGAFSSWLDGRPPEYEIKRDDALPREVDEWDSYLRFDVGRYMGDIELIRGLKRESIEGLVALFPGWRKSTQTFAEDVAGEVNASGKGYMDAYLKFMLRIGAGDYTAILDSPMHSMVVQHMLHLLPKDMEPDEQLRKCWNFFSSLHFANVPLRDLESRIFATLKAHVKSGAYPNPEAACERLKGFFYDSKHIATYAPYCDAFVMDQPMAELVSQRGVALEERYGVRVFSLNNWDDLLDWIDAREATMTDEHRAGLIAAYS
jgi:hypothetical protein